MECTSVISKIERHEAENMKGVTPFLAYTVIEEASHRADAQQTMQLLLEQSLITPLKLVKRFVGDKPRLDLGTLGEPFSQPEYVRIVRDLLLEELFRTAWTCTIGVPRIYHIGYVRQRFSADSWWTISAPALPLGSQTLATRALAWYMFWFAEYADDTFD